jgi:ubiquitin carboxyl-terminal hydrolase 4/11/15
MCQGQLKSRVVCPDCKKDSITFDPFMFLSVPLPQTQDKVQEVIYVNSAWVSLHFTACFL